MSPIYCDSQSRSVQNPFSFLVWAGPQEEALGNYFAFETDKGIMNILISLQKFKIKTKYRRMSKV